MSSFVIYNIFAGLISLIFKRPFCGEKPPHQQAEIVIKWSIGVGMFNHHFSRGAMPFTVEYDPEEETITARVQGGVNLGTLQDLVKEIVSLVKQKDCHRVLSDMREADLLVSMGEMYFMPQFIQVVAAEKGVNLFNVQRAFLAAQNDATLQFFELIAVNRNHHTKMFFELEEARAWLKNH